MRKILLLFAVLLTSVGASAQTFVTPETGHYYIIKGDHATYPWLTGTVEGGGIDVSNSEGAAAVYLKTANGLKVVATGKYLGTTSNGQISLVDSEDAVTIEAAANNKCYIKTGGRYLYNNQNDYTREAGNKTADLGNDRLTWGFIEVANPGGIVDGVYTINNIYNGRGTLTYGTYSGADYWGLTNITLSGYTDKNITVSNESNQQWCVVTTEKGTFFYNVGKECFMQNTVAGDKTKVTFGETVPQSGFTTTQRDANSSAYISVMNGDYYLTFSCGWAPNDAVGQIRWCTDSEEAATLLTFKKVAGDHTAIINKVMKKLYPNTEAKAALGEAIAAFDQYNIGDKVGEYSSSIANYGGEYAGILAFYNDITDDTEISAIEEKTARANEILDSFSLNMPKNGKFYRIAYNYGEGVGKLYLQSTASNVEGKVEGLALTAEEGATSIWYYDGGLISYDKGKYLKEDGSSRGLQNIGTTQTVTFSESTRTKGRYLIQASSFLHASTENGVYFADHCGSNTADHATHDFIIEEVKTIPVSISAADYATLYSPVALETTGNVEAYTITVNGEWAHLDRIEDNIIPAKTGVVLFHENESTERYDFVITSTDANVETSPLVGTFAATYIEGPAYVLGNRDGVVGFYQAELNRDANGNTTGTTHFLNNAFKAYLPASAVTSNVKALRFNFGETTGIETLVPATDANAPIYDLSGRRVLSTVKGGVYIQNGKKFIVK